MDLDGQAVEVTKLNLLLKCLEGETSQTLGFEQRLFRERALPDLGRNILCGNSLIGTDIIGTEAWNEMSEEERRKVNPFDYERAFPQVFKNKKDGGFDAVVGNPPYIRIQTLREFSEGQVEALKSKYKSASEGNYDIYVVFIERALDLVSNAGKIGFIVPHKFFNSKYGAPLRAVLSAGRHLDEIVHFGDQQVFEGATTYTCLLFLAKRGQESFRLSRPNDLSAWQKSFHADSGEVASDRATSAEWNFTTGETTAVFDKMKAAGVPLGELASIFVGLQTSADTVFLFKDTKTSGHQLTKVFSKELEAEFEIESAILKPVIRSGKIGRYFADPNALVLFPYRQVDGRAVLIGQKEMRAEFPKAWDYLCKNRELLAGRERGKFDGDGWYQLYPKNLDGWDLPKAMVPYMTTRLAAYLDLDSSFFVNVTTGGFGVRPNSETLALPYLIGLLNSRLLDWFFKLVSSNFHSGYFAANKQYLVQLPIAEPKAGGQEPNRLVSLVDTMLSLHKRLSAEQLPQRREQIEREIDATDRQIDQLVYQLYELSDDEIRIVEEATA